jgi:Uma2 family endonuclease
MLQSSALPVNRHDYQEMSEGPPYYQVIEGNLVRSPSPTPRHQDIALKIASLIGNHLEKKPIGRVFIAPLDVFLDDFNIYQPDVIFIANPRLDIITDKGIEGAPDSVVEILSPSTARFDKGAKRKRFDQSGVKEFWLVDPETRAISVYLPGKEPENPMATHGEKSVFESSLLPGLKFKPAFIFQTLSRPTT